MEKMKAYERDNDVPRWTYDALFIAAGMQVFGGLVDLYLADPAGIIMLLAGLLFGVAAACELRIQNQGFQDDTKYVVKFGCPVALILGGWYVLRLLG